MNKKPKKINKRFDGRKKPQFDGEANIEVNSISKVNDNLVLVFDFATANRLHRYAVENNDMDIADYIANKAKWRLDKNLK